jgi:Putative auto-transporter adhesin, head GIN domain
MLRIAAVLSSLLLLAACNWSDTIGGIKGSGNLKTETRKVENFTAIVVSGSANLEIEQTGEESLEITIDDNLLPLYTTEVRNGILYIGFAEGKSLTWSWNGKGPRIKVTVRDLRKLTISGAAAVKATKLDTDSLSITISGAASGSFAGRSDDLSINVSGAGSLDAVDLRAKRATVVVSGAGDVTVNASEELDARVSGAGDISYVGSPKLRSKVSGVGSIKQKYITN